MDFNELAKRKFHKLFEMQEVKVEENKKEKVVIIAKVNGTRLVRKETHAST